MDDDDHDDDLPAGSCEECGADVFDDGDLCGQCEWWVDAADDVLHGADLGGESG